MWINMEEVSLPVEKVCRESQQQPEDGRPERKWTPSEWAGWSEVCLWRLFPGARGSVYQEMVVFSCGNKIQSAGRIKTECPKRGGDDLPFIHVSVPYVVLPAAHQSCDHQSDHQQGRDPCTHSSYHHSLTCRQEKENTLWYRLFY